MALVDFGYEVVLSLIDVGGGVGTKRYQLNGTASATPAAAAAARDTIVAAFNAVSDLLVIGTRLELVQAEDTIVLPTSAEKEDEAIVTYAILDQPLKSGTFTIPGANIGIFTGAVGKPRNIVDITDTALVTYANLFSTGGVALISDGEQLDYMKEGNRRKVGTPNG